MPILARAQPKIQGAHFPSLHYIPCQRSLAARSGLGQTSPAEPFLLHPRSDRASGTTREARATLAAASLPRSVLGSDRWRSAAEGPTGPLWSCARAHRPSVELSPGQFSRSVENLVPGAHSGPHGPTQGVEGVTKVSGRRDTLMCRRLQGIGRRVSRGSGRAQRCHWVSQGVKTTLPLRGPLPCA